MRPWLAGVFLFLAACSQQTLIERFSTPEDRGTALAVAQQLREGRANEVAALAQPQLRNQIPSVMPQIRAALSAVPGRFMIEAVSSNSVLNGPTTRAFTLQAGSGSHYALVEIVLQGVPGNMELAGFHVQPFGSDPKMINQFRLGERGPLGYIWLAMMAACPLICLWAVFLIWRRPWLKRRWLWTIGSLLGFVGFGMNWATGALAILFVNISLLGVRAMRVLPYGPWILSFGVPIVAIIVIISWYRLPRQALPAT